jgi:hypothetical protein
MKGKYKQTLHRKYQNHCRKYGNFGIATEANKPD